MFKIAVNNLVQSIGDDVYLPSPSTASSKNLAPLSLVEREESLLPFRRCTHYYTTDFTLHDVVVDKDVQFKIEPDQPFCTFNRESTIKCDGNLQGALAGIFDAGVQRVDEVIIKSPFGQLCISEVNMQSLLSDLHKNKINMYHELVRELSSKKRKALCVVTGVVKTTKDTSVTASLNHSFGLNIDDDDEDESETEKNTEGESSSNAGEGKSAAEGNQSVAAAVLDKVVGDVIEGELKAVHERNSKRVLNLPAGTVVAYQVMELAVSDDGTVRLMVSHGAKGGFHFKSLKNQKVSKKG